MDLTDKSTTIFDNVPKNTDKSRDLPSLKPKTRMVPNLGDTISVFCAKCFLFVKDPADLWSAGVFLSNSDDIDLVDL